MGNCMKKAEAQWDIPADSILFMDSDMLKHALKGALVENPLLADRHYACLRKEDYEKFLNLGTVKDLAYIREKFDCDDFARALAGRASEWWGKNGNSVEAGIAFGELHGDLRKVEEPDKPRPHAINFFVDNQPKLWFVEPQTGEVFDKMGTGSTIWRLWL